MASLVVDSSVVIKWFDTEPYSIEAERILLAYEQGLTILLTPDLLPAEVGNIIWKSRPFSTDGQQWKHKKCLTTFNRSHSL